MTSLVIFSAVNLPSHQTQAQIIEAARIELADSFDSVKIGREIHVTQNAKDKPSYIAIVKNHEQNIRGVRSTQDIINLGFSGDPAWLVFSVTNTGSHQDWVLDMGSALSGKSGFLRTLFVHNETTNQTAIRYHSDNKNNLDPNRVYLNLPPNKTSLIVASIEMERGSSGIIYPRLIKVDMPHYIHYNTHDNIIPVFILLLSLTAGFFIAVSLLRANPNYILFSSFYLINTALLTSLQFGFTPSVLINNHIANILFFISIMVAVLSNNVLLKIDNYENLSSKTSVALIVVLGIVMIFKAFITPASALVIFILFYSLPTLVLLSLAVIAFIEGQRGDYGAIPLSFAWLFGAIGLVISGLSATSISVIHPVFLQAYWISLIPQAFFLIWATISKIRLLQIEEKESYVRKSEKALSKAKALQERESEDQAKLMRVIERERELMAGLRELEVHRAEEMRQAKDEADEANRAKSAFLAVVSHEVRTPMTGILGMVRLLLKSKLNDQQQDYVMAVQNSGETMMALLNDILDFEKIETGNMELEYVDFDLPQLVTGITTLMSGHVSEKNITLTANIDPDVPRFINGDPTRLRQVILNLVNNAIKFTETGGVTIGLKAIPIEPSEEQASTDADYEVHFWVEDTGIGISEEAQISLFDPFAQAESSTTRKYGGTGLGLAICKKLIEVMGSSISLSSKIGKGSKFSFILLMNKGVQENGISEKTLARQSDFSQDIQTSDVPAKTVLVVEDNDMNRKVLEGFMTPLGHSLIMAESGEKAVEICQAVIQDTKPMPDFILMDIQMPGGMNGVETAQAIRALDNPQIKSLPIVALTGNVGMDDVRSYYKAGFDGFLAKPIEYDQLKDVIQKIDQGTLVNPLAETIDQNIKSIDTSIPDHWRDKEEAKQDTSPAIQSFANQQAPISETNHFTHHDDIVPPQGALEDTPEDLSKNISLETPSIDNPQNQDAPNTSLLDMTMLDSLMTTLGKEQCQGLIDGFLEKADELVEILKDITLENPQHTYEKAHELKGMAANFGMKEISDMASAIESAAKEQDQAILDEKQATLVSVYGDSKTQLNDWFAAQS